MSFDYDPESDAVSIRISDKPVADTDEDSEGTIIDYDADGNIVGFEILKASRRNLIWREAF